MEVRVGTSGYSYKEWNGRFYPEDLPDSERLAFYSSRFGSVEINNTFYRMPSRDVLSKWAEQVSETFVFVLKAPQRITHQRRLKGAEKDVEYFLQTSSVLSKKLGPMLFQLPPFQKKDAERLKDFLALLPDGQRAAFEFRHPTWFDEEVLGILKSKGAALCQADTDEGPVAEIQSTANWGYLRLRRQEYD